MESQKFAGAMGALVAAIVLAAAFYYAPKGVQMVPQTQVLQTQVLQTQVLQTQVPQTQVQKAEAPKGPVVQDITPGAPAVRGPVVRDIAQ